MIKQRGWRAWCTLGTIGLTGCFSTVHHVQKVQVQAPESYKTASVEELEKSLSARDAAIRTLSATVTVTASTGGEKTGKVKTYTSFRGFIFVQKPRQLRVVLLLPLIGSRALDMVSDGSAFTLLVPPHSVAYVGTDEVTKPSANGLENLRPKVFLDSLLVPGVAEDELVTMTESTRVVEPARGRHDAVEEPDYDVLVLRRLGGNMLQRKREVHINRENLLPYEQDVYDDQGRVVTHAVYENYQPTGAEGEPLPRTITISRPLDQYSLKIDVSKLTLNETFNADEFVAPHIPATFKIVKMQ